MAQESKRPKFPNPIPNPAGDDIPELNLDLDSPENQQESRAGHSQVVTSPFAGDDEKTDPNLTLPPVIKQHTRPQAPQAPSRPAQPQTPRAAAPQAPIAKTVPLRPVAQPADAAPAQPPRTTIKMPEMGSLNVFMKDPEVSEIMVNDVRNVMIEKAGKMSYSGFTFSGVDEINRVVRNILDVTGRVLSPDQPYLDVALPDGSRVNIVAPPLTTHGPCITIRKFPSRRFTIDNLMANGMLDQRMAYFLNMCVQGKMNVLICGGTGSGKTTFLNALSNFIPKSERLITIEDTPELIIPHANSVKMQTKPQTPTSAAIHARDLVANALRMRPDRIIVGECRKAEALDMLQAMNTGHSGSMTTIHANSPRDGLSRLETLCMMSGVELPLLAIRKQIVSAIDLIIQIRRFRSGRRRVIAITEVTGMEGETVTLQDIFLYETDTRAAGGVERGTFKCTGFVPTFLDRLKEHGIELPRNYFA